MTITPSIFEAFLKCPTKCWLRFTGETPAGNTYAEWVKAESESYRANATRRLIEALPIDETDPPSGSSRREEAHYSTQDLRTAKWQFAVNVAVQ